MAKEVIAIDLDDVLASHAGAFIEFSNSKFGTLLQLDDYRDQWGHVWQLEHEETERRAAEFLQSENVASFSLKEESKSALEKLASKYCLYIVTARRQKNIDITYQWIERYLPGIFEGVKFVPIWEPNNKVTKFDICSQIGARYLIDDLSHHCNIAAEGGIEAILFGSYGWNRNENIVPGVTRCANWQEVLDYFKM